MKKTMAMSLVTVFSVVFSMYGMEPVGEDAVAAATEARLRAKRVRAQEIEQLVNAIFPKLHPAIPSRLSTNIACSLAKIVRKYPELFDYSVDDMIDLINRMYNTGSLVGVSKEMRDTLLDDVRLARLLLNPSDSFCSISADNDHPLICGLTPVPEDVEDEKEASDDGKCDDGDDVGK